MNFAPLPFLSLPEPALFREGASDPLGLSAIGDRLADWILPGLSARMSRPRFLTAIAVSAAVCDGLEEEVAADKVTPAHIVFEWLLIEGFARLANDGEVLLTPGIERAQGSNEENFHMSAATYLKSPRACGFHGVYAGLAKHLGIIDDDLRLGEAGRALLKVWQEEQNIQSFLDLTPSRNSSMNIRQVLRSAIEEGLENGYTNCSVGWQGWSFFAQHLTPARIGTEEATFIRQLMLDPEGETRGEIFRLVEQLKNFKMPEVENEAVLVANILSQASEELSRRLRVIECYEQFCASVEITFDWLRYLSSQVGARTLQCSEFAATSEVQSISTELNGILETARQALAESPKEARAGFGRLVDLFEEVDNAEGLYTAILSRHAEVQKAGLPEGRREWFERAGDGSILVRASYMLDAPPVKHDLWKRSYRLNAVRSFCRDLSRAVVGGR
jgi:hypothetical protein